MDKFGIGKIGMPGFGIGRFRLPVFGSGSGVGGAGSKFHPSLVDAWFMSGISNADNPSFIEGVKGNKLQLKNFAYALSSGFGKYECDFRTWYGKTGTTSSDHSVAITGIRNNTWIIFHNPTSKVKGFKVRVEGIREDVYINYSYYVTENDTIVSKDFLIDEDGIYSLPESEPSTNAVGFHCYSASHVGDDQDVFIGITITQLPSDYEGALVFDGVDDYGILEDKEPLTDFTVICRRYYVEKTDSATASCRTAPQYTGAFVLEMMNASGKPACCTYGNFLSVDEIPANDNVVVMTPNSYNGNTLVKGNYTDGAIMLLGAGMFGTNAKVVSSYSVSAIYYFALYNKSLTAEEIEQQKTLLNEEWQKRLLNV